MRRNTLAPPVVVERMVVDGRAYAPAAGEREVPGAFVGVAPDKLEVHYAAMSYRAPGAGR